VIVDPNYVVGLASLDDATLRAKKREVTTVENSLSYYRRLAQARQEILQAETARRAEGGSVSDLIARLPQILGAETSRTGVAQARFIDPDAEIHDLAWPDGRERLVLDDDSLATLPVLSDDELARRLERITEFERELSDLRRHVHDVLGAIEQQVVARAAAGA
jgi:hypothetical protein